MTSTVPWEKEEEPPVDSKGEAPSGLAGAKPAGAGDRREGEEEELRAAPLVPAAPCFRPAGGGGGRARGLLCCCCCCCA